MFISSDRLVAVAPKNTKRKVQSMADLDKEIKYVLPTAASGGIDLSILAASLSPQEAVRSR